MRSKAFDVVLRRPDVFDDWGLVLRPAAFPKSAALLRGVVPGSPAFDVGDNTPPGGLGSTDFDGRPRIADGIVDIGIFEGLIVILIDGFESGDTSAWTKTLP